MSQPIVVETGPQYSASAITRKHAPPPRQYDEYRDCLRLEFTFACAYCLSTEREAGQGETYGGFEIEHFKPKGRDEFRHLRNEYSNLLWACRQCNRVKGHKWPSKQERALGMRFVDPTKEALGHFVQIRGLIVESLNNSAAGMYIIDEIRLNSAVHLQRRRERAERATQLATVEAVCQALRAKRGARDPEIAADLDRLEQQVAQLRAAMKRSVPLWDAPTGCACAT